MVRLGVDAGDLLAKRRDLSLQLGDMVVTDLLVLVGLASLASASGRGQGNGSGCEKRNSEGLVNTHDD